MCGIVGIVEFSGQPTDAHILLKMRDRMEHRGPDDYGAVLIDAKRRDFTARRPGNGFLQFRDEDELKTQACALDFSIGLAHRRLSIVDLSESGRQPMCNEDGSIWITYNGEVYNFNEIRKALQTAGHSFHSKTDTEVIIHAYEQWGMDCLQRFIGMFAFGIWDCRREELILARDRIGVKPLYYCIVGTKLLFASEIKAILEHPEVNRGTNQEALYHYLSFHCVPAPMTLFTGILKLEAGHYLISKNAGDIRIVPYWNMFRLRNDQSLNRPEKEVCEEILYLFRDATRLRMISDVPFGAFLSGGIDSTLNVAVMSQLLSTPVNTFSVGFKDSPEFDELHWARMVAREFGTNHHEMTLSAEDTLAFLVDMVYYQDEPIADPVCVPVYFVSKLAKGSGVTVCQVGEGSDELFCGYPSWLEALKDYPSLRSPFVRLQKLPMLFAAHCISRIFDRAWGTYGLCLPYWNRGEVFWGGAVYYRDEEKRALLSSALHKNVTESTRGLIARYRRHFNEVCYKPDDLAWLTYVDLCIRLPELLLMRLDKMNMAASLEGRVPFLDHRLVELILSLPQSQKVNGNETKHLLKRAIRGIVPDAIIDRPKMGFQLPISKWYQSHLHDRFMELFNDFSKNTAYFSPNAIRRFNSKRGVPWIIMNFVLWHRMWIERKALS
jgi:asparagine synthase (glutamine-hydrolysing)